MVPAKSLRKILFGYVLAVSLACLWVPRRVTYYQPEQLGPYWCGYSLLWHPLDKIGPLASDDGPFLRTYSVDYLVLALEYVGLTGLLIVLLLFAAKPGPEASIDASEDERPR
ncbi:MAG: hypothetical protein WBQ34_16150 [Candidatus Acidiferrales bacterium]